MLYDKDELIGYVYFHVSSSIFKDDQTYCNLISDLRILYLDTRINLAGRPAM